MPVAVDYPFLDVLWTMLLFFAWIAWLLLVFRVIGDIFRRQDLGGGAKVVWLVLVILLPFLGVFAYLLTQGGHMAERDLKDATAARAQFDDYVKTVAGGSGPAGEIEKAHALLSSGAITQAEFDEIKRKALAT